MRIKNKTKFIRSIIIIFVLMLAIILLISKVTLSHKEVEYRIIHISKGDTLWSVALNNQKNNEYYKGKDIRYILDDIMKINNLNNSNLKINQELLIPII